jgi:hypothetical protein
MPSADQVPVKSPHSTMHWHKWVVLLAGSTGSALRVVCPPNVRITPDDIQRDLCYAASATGSLYRSPLAIIAHAILAILLASGIAATFVGRRANNAVSHGRAWCRGVWHGGPLYHFMNDTISELNGRLASTDYPNSGPTNLSRCRRRASGPLPHRLRLCRKPKHRCLMTSSVTHRSCAF